MESSISIVNLTQKTGTTNAADGSFEIIVREQDTLFFSSVQYETPRIKISSVIFREGVLNIRLNLQINELSEVRLSNISLSGNLTSDLKDIEVFDQAAVGFPLVGSKRRTGMEKMLYNMAGDPLSLMVNTLNGNLARLKRARKNFDFEKLIENGIESVSKGFFTENLGIPENEILSFVNHCAQHEKFKQLVSQEEPLELMEFYLNQAPSFLDRESE